MIAVAVIGAAAIALVCAFLVTPVVRPTLVLAALIALIVSASIALVTLVAPITLIALPIA